MKSKHIIAITALTFASLTSCTSVLDKDDLTAVSEKSTWNSEILATAFWINATKIIYRHLVVIILNIVMRATEAVILFMVD